MQKHYDNVPTPGSTNPVKSDGLHQQLATIGLKLDDLDSVKANKNDVARVVVGASSSEVNVADENGNVVCKVTSEGQIKSKEFDSSAINPANVSYSYGGSANLKAVLDSILPNISAILAETIYTAAEVDALLKNITDYLILDEYTDSLYIADPMGYVILKVSANGLEYYGQQTNSLPLEGYELFSLGDSLSAGGVWQTEVARVTGCSFDKDKNILAGAMLSCGGTSSYGVGFDNTMWRAYNLVRQGYIADGGEKAIIILENVNDGARTFDNTARTIIPTPPIEGYSYADWGVTLPSAVPSSKRALNSCLRLTKVRSGKNLKITSLPTKAGTVTIRAGWAGPGYSNYNIEVTASETYSSLIDKILEYDYTGITDVANEDGYSVDFAVTDNQSYTPTIQFTDTGNTGMSCTVTDTDSARSSVAMYFIGDSVSEWDDTTKWQEGITYSQGWKSSIELLQRTYPNAHIFVSQFPMHSVTQAEYLLPSGAYDTASYNSTTRMAAMRTMSEQLGLIASFYAIPFLNVFSECGITISNITQYYNDAANVHPKNTGYVRFGDTIAMQLLKHLNNRI